MKCTWEENDLRLGLFIIKQGAVVPMHHSNVFQISWTKPRGNMNNVYGLTAVFTDGMLHQIGTKADLAEYLNKGNYRPLSAKEVSTIVGRSYEGLF